MATIRDGINLTAKTNDELKSIVARLTADPEVADQYKFQIEFAQNWGVRQPVFEACIAIEAWKHVSTVTTVAVASPESMEWSNLEGGHRFHQLPAFTG